MSEGKRFIDKLQAYAVYLLIGALLIAIYQFSVLGNTFDIENIQPENFALMLGAGALTLFLVRRYYREKWSKGAL